MENEFLTFEAADVELIGDVFEFDEEVQRDEKVRFYTLNEQVTDAFEHMIPKGRTTRAQLEKIDQEVDRFRDLYSNFVNPTSEGYEILAPKSLRSFSWISPVYVENTLSTYDYKTQWETLFSPQSIRLPNGYTRMVTALPSPYVSQTGVPFPVNTATEFVDRDGKGPLRALPQFISNRTRRHEDGRIDVMKVPIDGTADTIAFQGYWLRARTLPIPDPLPEHPFLSSNEARFVPTTESLSERIPEMETVLLHGVPTTQDPYGEGLKYLKVYDISLSAIPWDLWKQRFPKKEVIDTTPPPIQLPFEESKNQAPSSNLVNEYGIPYFPGLAPRKWLMMQEDGGHLAIKMLQSKAGDSGTVEMLPLSELGDLRFPDIDRDACRLTGLTFNDFKLNGLPRQWEVYNKGKWVGYELRCIPLEIIQQERRQIGYRNREQWKEGSTSNDLKRDQQIALARARRFTSSDTKTAYEKYTVRASSQLREQVVAILNDIDRFPEDKLKDIQTLIHDSPHSNRITTDAEGLFVICDHTLAILGGDMATDRLAFYDTWTVRVDGSRVCKVCGEEVNNDVLVHQEDFTEEGRMLQHADALETASFHGQETLTFTTQLRSLQGLFDLSEPTSSTMFLLISLLQILPSQAQLVPVLQEARVLSETLRKRDADGKARGMVGIAATALLLQSHLPQLVPRRSFGALPLKLDGFPRDTDSDKAPTIVDSLLLVLRKTFESYPTSFKGPSVAVMRGALHEVPLIRKGVIASMRKLLPAFSAALQRAKSEFELTPPSIPIVGLIPVRLPPQQLGTITSFQPCANPHSIWANPVPPRIQQPTVPLDPVRPRPSTVPLFATTVVPRPRTVTDVKDIQRRIRLPSFPNTEGNSWRTNLMIVQRLKDVFKLDVDVTSIDTTQKPSLLRDIAEGLLKESLSVIVKDPLKRQRFEELREKDMALFSLLSQLKDAKTETNSARAKERHIFTDRLREMTDSQRQITKDLLDRGMAPFIITNADRDAIAAQLERELTPLEVEEEVGVGAPRDAPDEDEYVADEGDYGDHMARGNRERDQMMEDPDYEGPI